jgi:hypothetical protein
VSCSRVESWQVKVLQALGRLKELSPRSLRIIGTLDAASYTRFQRVLADPILGKTLRSRLEMLDLPIRSPNDTIQARDGGYSDPNDGVCDCSALIRFKSSWQEKEVIACEIGVLGSYDSAEDLAFGTPHRVIQSTDSALGLSPRHLDAPLLFGERPSHQRRVYDNPFVGYGLHFPNDPLHLTELALDHFALREIAPGMFDSFVISSLRKLKIKQCTELPTLFRRLISSDYKISIRVLEIDIIDYTEPFELLDPFNLQHFLASFHTLKTLRLRVATSWPMTRIISALQSHKELESCNIFIGEKCLKFWNVQGMRTAHPMLRELGHPIHNVTKALAGKRIDPEAVKEIRRLASELVKFSQLESWQLVCEKSDNGVRHHAAEALAKLMHKSCCQAARRIGICIVKRISISFITNGELQLKQDMRADRAPETLEFFFPSKTP